MNSVKERKKSRQRKNTEKQMVFLGFSGIHILFSGNNTRRVHKSVQRLQTLLVKSNIHQSYSQMFLPTQYASKVHPFLEVAETVNRFCEQ